MSVVGHKMTHNAVERIATPQLTWLQMEEKYDYELEERIMDWIEDVTGFAMDSFYDNLRNGQVSCGRRYQSTPQH